MSTRKTDPDAPNSHLCWKQLEDDRCRYTESGVGGEFFLEGGLTSTFARLRRCRCGRLLGASLVRIYPFCRESAHLRVAGASGKTREASILIFFFEFPSLADGPDDVRFGPCIVAGRVLVLRQSHLVVLC